MTDRPTLDELFANDEFVARHIGPDADDVATMLSAIGATSLDDLIDSAVPASIRSADPLTMEPARREQDVLAELGRLAGANEVMTSLIGLGYHDTVTPPVLVRNLLENPSWYTAYTPYQPEISQGRLEALLNFQTMVSDLTGRELTNASMLDEATAAAEAMTLLRRVNKTSAGSVFVVDDRCHPQTIAVIRTRAEPLDLDVIVTDPAAPLPEDTFGVLVAQFATLGGIRDLEQIVSAAHDAGALVAATTDLLALTLIESPGGAGVDAVVGSAQRFGVPLGFGGPHAGFLATREEYRRSIPGRLVGVSIDDEQRPALRLALQTREQHIRREKATSNICTAQVLLAVIASMYAVWHGPDGLARIARRTNRLATACANGLRRAGIQLVDDSFFDTVSAIVPGRSDAVIATARERGINLRRVDDDTVAVAFDETSVIETVTDVLAAFDVDDDVESLDATAPPSIPAEQRRATPYLEHPVFHEHRSETEMVRYVRRLAQRDLALDRSMIPLGSCTMKLNAAVEMEPITWPGFSRIHPFAPLDQAAGYLELIDGLERALVEITGYDAVSLQPNAGSQGELAGLLAIRSYHRDRGDDGRTICLIPASAHGTNAASAVMAGMRVVVVDTDDDGNIDIDDLERKAAEHSDALAAIMVTYPSTHGVFEQQITDVCAMVHDHGGQVYLDGANLNAMVGVAKPGRFGADVSHLNLHKTFCIPHGGGGPGVGPVACRAHLAPYLPNHPLVDEAGPSTSPGPVSAAPWGSAGILPISWAYVKLMGAEGLTRATAVAILGANYIAARLGEHYPVLYRGQGDRVAHECILDLRPIKDEAGVTVDDVAKRLIDYGFHAPTMSFPVPGTFMVEPTESEGLRELDRFCDAMIAIRGEIAAIAAGAIDLEASALRHAPHTAADVATDDWDRAYPRDQAAFPTDGPRTDRYWPPVGRIDGAYGDKHLVCSCVPLDEYRD
ncbi:MAG: aminomethyl-transferring glycine dehydrogenase [Acidimicrobiia bacterium]|nr:aminomethyl-transferring glycine dehydrogenase [Acidimicrobiia bacterium]